MKLVREKPHRLPREAYRGQTTISFTICVEDRVPLFQSHESTAPFIDMLRESTEKWSCVVAVYCFMPDHLHIILHGNGEKSDLWRAIVDFKQKSGYWLARHKRGISWQKDFYDHIVLSEADLAIRIRYLLDNPRRKGLVANWEEYPLKGSLGLELEDVLAGLPV